MDDLRQCSKCQERKPRSAFKPRRDGRDGLNAQCRTCIAARAHEYDTRPDRRAIDRERQRSEEHREYARRYHDENREHINARKRAWRARRMADPEFRQRMRDHALRHAARKRAIVHQIKADRGCLICGEREPACLDFHHRDPATKELVVGTAFSSKKLETILAEIEKCIVLCANCHRKLHAGVVSLPPRLRAVA